jgi:hypothetical protein
MLKAVITTIQEPTAAVRNLAAALNHGPGSLIVVGDRKGPARFELEGCQFLPLQQQLELPYQLARLLPEGHYARKNLGYLEAIRQDASCIYETDDDNAPLPSWQPRQQQVEAISTGQQGWVNAYAWFSEELIWPRGLPLDAIKQAGRPDANGSTGPRSCGAPIQQGLANLSPDVDAVWRLVLDRPFTFQPGQSLLLPPGAWCPFNSQSTWWWPIAYPLLYLPSHCSFRMTDIWRSFIAQRCLWELGHGLVFHGPEVIQERNEHDLLQDFEAEIPGYRHNRMLVQALENLELHPSEQAVGANLMRCYEALVAVELFPEQELILVRAWLDDLA